MTLVQIEAETHKYGPNVRMVLPLSDGSWAIFDHRRSLWLIVTEASPEIKGFLEAMFPYSAPVKDPGRVALEEFEKELSLGDLGL